MVEPKHPLGRKRRNDILGDNRQPENSAENPAVIPENPIPPFGRRRRLPLVNDQVQAVEPVLEQVPDEPFGRKRRMPDLGEPPSQTDNFGPVGPGFGSHRRRFTETPNLDGSNRLEQLAVRRRRRIQEEAEPIEPPAVHVPQAPAATPPVPPVPEPKGSKGAREYSLLESIIRLVNSILSFKGK